MQCICCSSLCSFTIFSSCSEYYITSVSSSETLS